MLVSCNPRIGDTESGELKAGGQLDLPRKTIPKAKQNNK